MLFQLDQLCLAFSKTGWEKYSIILCGVQTAFKILTENAPYTNLKEGKRILLELGEEEKNQLPDLYFYVMGIEYLKGNIFAYNEAKAHEMFSVLYERGDKNAFLKMKEIAKQLKR